MKTGSLLSEWPIAQNWIFVLFLFCFFITMQLFEDKNRLFISMLHNLFGKKEYRQSIFSESVNNELICKIFLCLQTAALSSLIIYIVLVHTAEITFESVDQLFKLLGAITLSVVVYILYKFSSVIIVGNIFFQKQDLQQWNETFFSLVSLNGLFLFIPALLMFYMRNAYFLCYFVLIYLFLVELLTIYKTFVIFFHHKVHFLYFILYLCGQEIIPLYFLYKVIVYFQIRM
jgi:hypothetical protein